MSIGQMTKLSLDSGPYFANQFKQDLRVAALRLWRMNKGYVIPLLEEANITQRNTKRRTNIQEANGRGHCKKLHPSFADEAHHHPPNQLNQSNLCVMLPHPSESPSGGRGLSCNTVELAVLLLLPQLLLLRCELRLASNQRPAGDVVRDIWDPRHLPP